MNATQWRVWFIRQRVELHNILVDCPSKAPDQEAQITAIYEHDSTVAALAKHAARRIARDDFVTVLAQRAEQRGETQCP